MKNLIRKILKETIDEFGWVPSDNDSATELIYDLLSDSNLVPMEIPNYKGWTEYLDYQGNVLFMDNVNVSKKPVLYLSVELFRKLTAMGLNDNQIKQLFIDVLWSVHNRKIVDIMFFPDDIDI